MSKSEHPGEKVLSQKAYSFLRKGIIGGKYKPGEPILESAISKELGVSRTPVREALKLLEKENLVNSYPRRGAFITIISLEKIQEIYQIREIIEGEVARLAASYISIDRLSQIEKKLLPIKRKLKRKKNTAIEEAVNVGQEFHDLIFSAFGNKTLIQIMENLRVEKERGCNFASRGVGNAIRFLDHHLEIISALKRKNGEKAKKLLNKHINDAKESILG